MRRVSLICGLALLGGGCFESGSSDDDSTGTETEQGSEGSNDTNAPDGSSGDPTGDESSTPTSDDSGTDDTTPGDDPPVITAFTVNGSSTASDLEDSDRVIVAAEVEDDNGVDRVEFYEGDTLLGTAIEPPYEVAVLLTSTDNGDHDFSARAFDSADQRTDSDVVTLTVDIDGGSQVAITEELFETAAIIIYPSVGIALADDGDVVITGAIEYEVDELSGTALMAQRWNPDLDEQRWATQTQNIVGEGVNLHFPYGQPSVDDEGFAIVGGIFDPQSAIEGTAAIYRIGDEPFGEPLAVLPEGEPVENIIPFAGLARAPSGDIYFAAPLENVTKFSPDLDEVWREPVLPTSGNDIAALRIITDAEGAPIIDAFLCAGEACSFTVRKLDPEDGSIEWTESSPYPSTSADFIGIGATAASPDGRLATFVSRPTTVDGEIALIIRDSSNGDLITETSIAPEDAVGYRITDAVYDEQGSIVVTGSVVLEGDALQAWVARITEDGTILWERRFEFYSAEATFGFGSGVVIDDRGRIYMSGVRDGVPVFPAFLGQAMLVQLNP